MVSYPRRDEVWLIALDPARGAEIKKNVLESSGWRVGTIAQSNKYIPNNGGAKPPLLFQSLAVEGAY